MRQYLLKYFVMYAVLAAVFAVVSALIRFPSTIGMLIPGLLAALIGQGYVRDHLQPPTNRERLQFAGIAAVLTAALGVALLFVATALVRQALSTDSETMSFLEPGDAGLFAGVLFVLNFATIYIGVGLGARGALNRIAHPEAFPSRGRSIDSGTSADSERT